MIYQRHVDRILFERYGNWGVTGTLKEYMSSVFNTEDGGDTFIRNVGLSPNYTVSVQKAIPFIVTALRT
jgi:hypothetical protein